MVEREYATVQVYLNKYYLKLTKKKKLEAIGVGALFEPQFLNTVFIISLRKLYTKAFSTEIRYCIKVRGTRVAAL